MDSKKTCLLFVTFTLFILSTHSQPSRETEFVDTYHEDLFLKPLVDGKLFAHFQFKTLYKKDIKSLRWENKLEIFPLSLADLVATTDLNKLHFSLTKGNWNYRNWGYPARSSPPGAQILAKFSKHNEDPARSWKRLVNSLAGKFCASLASADKRQLVASKIAFNQLNTLSNTSEHVLYSNLPEETLCTENLTPWKKLLPCHTSSGLSSSLNAVNLLKSSYSSLSIDLEPVPCTQEVEIGPDCEQVQLTQSIDVVFNPILQFEGKQTWSLAKIFGNSINKRCPLADHSFVYVDITSLDDKTKLYPNTYKEHRVESTSNDARIFAAFNLGRDDTAINIGIKQNQLFKKPPISKRLDIPVHLKTHISGIGADDGTFVATVSNSLDKPIRIAYMDVIPYFLRVYTHTLTVRTKSGQELRPDRLNLVLSKDTSTTLIEFSLEIPAYSEVQISYDFERAFLRFTDFKPDANKGVLLGSALISIPIEVGIDHLVIPSDSSFRNNNTNKDDTLRIYARPLLVILPTPDFSMPYNVICLVCTALVAAFGPLHSMTTKKPMISKQRVEDKK